MPSLDVAGSVMVDPLHTGPTASNVGVTAALTVTVSVAVVAQVDDVGVNVQVVVAVLLTDGLHVPAMPSFDVAGSIMDDPEHTGAIGSNVGVTAALTVTVSVVVVAQLLPDGVKV